MDVALDGAVLKEGRSVSRITQVVLQTLLRPYLRWSHTMVSAFWEPPVWGGMLV
jgi:hypothetical protein